MPRKIKKANSVLTLNADHVIKSIDDTAAKRMNMATQEVRGTALETLSGLRTGRTYTVPGTHRTYTASAPGEPPAQRTGRLRQSVKIRIKVNRNRVVGQVGTPLDYGARLEYGTENMAARPWLLPSFKRSLDTVKEILSRKWM